MKKFFIIAVIIAVIAGVATYFIKDNNKKVDDSKNITNVTKSEVENSEVTTNEATSESLPEETEGLDLFESYYSQSESLLKTMTIEEKVGQMFLVRFPDSGALNQVKSQSPGGYILFGKDFRNERIHSFKN